MSESHEAEVCHPPWPRKRNLRADIGEKLERMILTDLDKEAGE